MPFAKLVIQQEASSYEIQLPQTLKTPSGLALIEIQGRINAASNPLIQSPLDLEQSNDEDPSQKEPFDSSKTRILGDLEFIDDKNVTLCIGSRQRLRGKIVALNSPLAVLSMHGADMTRTQLSQKNEPELVEIPVLDIIRYKVLFNTRPEPVTQ